MKGQGALEYLIIIAAVLGISAVVVLFVGGAFIGSSGGADLSKCRLAAANCQKDMATGLSSTCPYCDTACKDSRGNDVLSGTPGCGEACQQCKKGAMTGGGSTPVTGMVAQWTFDEGKGRRIADSSGQSNNATFYGTLHNGALNSGATWEQGKYGNAVKLDGTSGYVRMENMGSLPQGTIMLWIKFNRAAATNGPWEGVVQGNLTSGATYHIFNYNDALGTRDGKGLTFFSSSLEPTTTKTPTNGVWYHLAMTWDGVNKFAYVNGILEAQGAGAYPADLSDLALGEYYYPNPNYYLKASIDSFRVFDRNMTKEQIQAEMNSQIAANRSILDLEFDEGAGAVANDTRMWVKGKSGAALAFNGIDDSLNIPLSVTMPADLANRGEWTFEGWVLHDSKSPLYSALFWGKYHQPRTWWTNMGSSDNIVLSAWLVSGTYDNIVYSPAPTNDVFHHVAFLQSASRGVSEIWVDGVKVASSGFMRIDKYAAYYTISSDDPGDEHFKGIIDEAHVYNRSLSDIEIIALYNAHK